ncbi:MAG: hypothetical protein AB7N65_25655 [Vicinamibacterales bacterium]
MSSELSSLWLRHTVATLAYRAEKALRDAPPGFAEFQVSPDTRAAIAIVGHMGDLMEWAERMARGEKRWEAVPPMSWAEATDRFYRTVAALDAAIAQGLPEGVRPEVLFQGPVADALTHVGQLMMMRRAAGAPVRSENYARASISVGRVGREQAAVRSEFDDDASASATPTT